ncbi:hypothetical protein Droror1_Dr00016244 [Drosera rotundifolia]
MEKSMKGSSKSSAASSSSIATELFGPKEPSSSSGSVFGSVFDSPATTGKGRSSQRGNSYSEYRTGDSKHERPDNVGQSKEQASYYQQETVGSCYFSSSIYYGGQEVYAPSTCKADTNPSFKKDERDDDQDGGNPNDASRGNWWQGSLYY